MTGGLPRISWRRFSLRWGSLALLLCAPLWLAPTGCTSDGLIGGECADGFDFCDGACIPVSEDEANCGQCNNACPRGVACVDGLCGGPGGNGMGGAAGMTMGGGDGSGGINVGAGGPGGRDTGGSGNGGDTGGRGGNNGTGADGGDGSGASGNGTGGNANGTGASGGGECLPPYDTPAACGDCETQCGGGTPNCSPDGDGSYECVANCLEEPYITECNGTCVDVQVNPFHCGRCGNFCPSGICVDGGCIGATSGHLIAMCMNFEAQSPQQTRLLQNSVFLPPGATVRILGFTQRAEADAEAGTDAALALASVLAGRSYELTKVSAASIVVDDLTRNNYDVLLVYDQAQANDGELRDLGDLWAAPIQNFTRTGGVVVVLTGGGGTDQMPEFLDAIDFFQATDTLPYRNKRFYVQAPGDAVGVNVVSPFQAVSTSCLFETPDTPGGDLEFVVSDTDPDDGVGDPAVVHRIISD